MATSGFYAWHAGSFPSSWTNAAARLYVTVSINSSSRQYWLNFYSRMGSYRNGGGCWTGQTYAYGYGNCNLYVDGAWRTGFSADYDIYTTHCPGNYYWMGGDSSAITVGPFGYNEYGGGREIGFYLTTPYGFTVSGSIAPDNINPAYSAPTGVSGTNLVASGLRGQGRSRINVGSWGNYSDRSWYVVSKTNNRNPVSEWGASSNNATFDWAHRMGSNQTTAWYAEALNNHGYTTFVGPYYISRVSIPNAYAVGNGTTPATTLSSSVEYRGGLGNSTTNDSANLVKWNLYYKREDQNWSDQDAPQQSISSSSKNVTFSPIPYTTFNMGYNYDVSMCPINEYGAWGDTSNLSGGVRKLYAPQDIKCTTNNDVPKQLTITCSATRAGGFGASNDTSAMNNGTIWGYRVRYATTEEALDQGTYQETPFQAQSTIVINNLSLSTKYYYRIVAYNTLGLSAISKTYSITTRSYYEPSGETITFTAGNVTTGTQGVTANVSIAHPGGLTPDSGTMSSVKMQVKPESSNTYTTVATFTNSSTGTLTWSNSSSVNKTGNYDVLIVMTNQYSVSSSRSFKLLAPTNLKASNVEQYTTSYNAVSPTQAQADVSVSSKGGLQNGGNITSSTNICWRFYMVEYDTEQFPEYYVPQDKYSTTTYYDSLPSTAGLNYGTRYSGYVTVTNDYGMKSIYGPIDFNTDEQTVWTLKTNKKPNGVKAVLLYRSSNNPKETTKITKTFYIAANSLGSVEEDDDLRNTRLKFDTASPIWVSADNQAYIKLSNNKYIAYAYDSSDDVFKFAIFNSVALTTNGVLVGTGSSSALTFFREDTGWQMQYYDVPDTTGYTVTVIGDCNGRGLNASSPFSGTRRKIIPLWEESESE